MSDSAQLARIIAISGSAISGLLAILIVGGVLYSALILGRVPETLSNWGGIIIGFFFGQFFSFVRAVLDAPGSGRPGTASSQATEVGKAASSGNV
jgi:hypothetical protein